MEFLLKEQKIILKQNAAKNELIFMLFTRKIKQLRYVISFGFCLFFILFKTQLIPISQKPVCNQL